MTTLTHQERAERVRELLRIPPNKTFRVTPGERRYAMNIIAREMYPRELVEAARCTLFNAELSPDPRMGGATDVYLVPTDDIEALRLALALYPEPEEETEHER